METVGAIVASGVAGLLGFMAGGRWAPTAFLGALLFGVPFGIVAAGLYFISALFIAQAWPELIDARSVGLHVMALVIVGAMCSGIGIVFGYRKSLGARLF
ncbi:hypothetical protein SAMN02745126_02113 [Enhydrobacter aerosaccus]|uniref:Uncharacterized protein n=1 Tax=Enhydrobacter aerosaccus TaxID=225324 RepID=A0A1T4N611_9HYPH|nr:hypothetical protein [Enhydrobacter aerosaccus]SJZ74298.1 hypothetical protein SAMN02745126_02113 [Enhydrobacter aerosaccus]